MSFEKWLPTYSKDELYDLLERGKISAYQWNEFESYLSIYLRSFWFLAISKENLDAIKSLIKVGADIDIIGYGGITPLMLAAGNGHLNIVKFLVEAGANIDAIGQHGDTALECAKSSGRLEIVNYLKEKMNE